MTDQIQEPAEAVEPPREPVFMMPMIVAVLAGSMILIQALQSFVLSPEWQAELTFWLAFDPLRFIEADRFEGGWVPLLWQPFTHAFLHAGWEHVLVNCAWMVIFATPVARRYGPWRLLVLFLVCSAVGAAAFAVTTLPERQILLGASGGIAGLTGAAVRFMFQPVIMGVDRQTGERIALGRHLASLRELLRQPQSRTFILFWVLLNAAAPLLPLFTGGVVEVAWQAHLGGFFSGLLLVPLLERRQPEPPPHLDQ